MQTDITKFEEVKQQIQTFTKTLEQKVDDLSDIGDILSDLAKYYSVEAIQKRKNNKN